jgi:hypothetical protein
MQSDPTIPSISEQKANIRAAGAALQAVPVQK